MQAHIAVVVSLVAMSASAGSWTEIQQVDGPGSRQTTGVGLFDALFVVDGWECVSSASCEYQSDTWSYTLGIGWQKRGTGLQSKTPLMNSALSAYPFDPFGGRIFQQGGKACFPCQTSDSPHTWEWFIDESRPAGAWEQGPPGKCGLAIEQHTMSYDPVRQTIVLFGGYDGAQVLGDVWELDQSGTYWVHSLTPSTPGPGARCGHVSVWAPYFQAVLVYGGARGGTYLGDSWLYDGERWRRGPLSVDTMPKRAGAGMVVDARDLNVIVLYGGHNGPPPYLSDTWELRGNAWSKITTGTTPPWRTMPAMAGTSKGVLMFGGQWSYGRTRGDLWWYK